MGKPFRPSALNSKNLKSVEQHFIQMKQHLEDISTGKCPPEQRVKQPASIYAGFLDYVKDNNKNLIPEVEAEVYKNIVSFEDKIATKRIMELMWIVRKELAKL